MKNIHTMTFDETWIEIKKQESAIATMRNSKKRAALEQYINDLYCAVIPF